jgi:two-component system osmolarity sensor histidine kinase EnvZ
MTIKKYIPQGLFARTLLIILVPVLLLQITVSVVFFERHWSKMTERLAFSVTGDINAIIQMIDDNPSPENIVKIQSIATHHFNLQMSYQENIKIFPDIEITKNKEVDISKDLRRDMAKNITRPFVVKNIPDRKQTIVYVLLQNGLLSISVPEGRLYSASSYIFILWMLGLSVLLFTISMMFMRNQIRPIHRLGIIAERLGRGIPVGKIKPSGAREVRQAAKAFMNMQERINQYIEQRTTMLAGVSHDLRTPLTRMKLQLEIMDEIKDRDALHGDIQDMEHMIEGYLSFAKGDGGEEMQRVALNNVLDKMIEDAKRMNMIVIDNRKEQEAMIVWLKPKSFSRALDNFLSNSVRFASQIALNISISEEFVTIVIEDNGSGIEPNKIPEMLKPFVRGDASRNQKTGGVGLGLTIAQDIISAHGGTLELGKSDSLGGLEVKITLPI